jgi:hypothetical protein
MQTAEGKERQTTNSEINCFTSFSTCYLPGVLCPFKLADFMLLVN